MLKIVEFYCGDCASRFEAMLDLPSGVGTLGHESQCGCGQTCPSVLSAPTGWVASEGRTSAQLKRRSLDHHKRVVGGKEPDVKNPY